MLFLFDHVGVDQHGAKWNIEDLELPKLKAAMIEQQSAVKDSGWASLYFNNHDQPRALSRWGDTSSTQLREKSAKALALMLHMHKGTPYVYQGEEIGMTNAGFTKLEQYRDLESINAYHQRVDQAKVQDAASMMDSLAKVSRDNSRTPMQWDSSTFAGFTPADSPTSPWLEVNSNKNEINAEKQRGRADSVFSFYRRLIELRHTDHVVAAGDFSPLDAQDEHVYAFLRSVGERRLLVVVNVSSLVVEMPEQTLALIGETPFESSRVVISNEDAHAVNEHIASRQLDAWSAFVYEI
jgi:oligo-1,6-glucosidase